MMVEDKILEYLDGSLGDDESAELLETLSVSPEKRALLEEHLRLKDLLTLGRKPFAVPVETERSLARSIPILGKYDDDLAPFLGPFASLRTWIGARAMGLAMGAGAMIVLAGLGWFALSGNGHNTPLSSTQPQYASAASTTTGTNATRSSTQNSEGPVVSDRSNTTPTSGMIHSKKLEKSISDHSGISDKEIDASVSTRNTSISSVPETVNPGSADIAQVEPMTSSVPAKAIPVEGNSAHSMHELLLPSPKELSPVSIGGSFILNESYLPALSTGPSHTVTAPTGDATVDYDLSPGFAVGIDLGERVGSSLANSSSFVTLSNNYTRFFESPSISNQTLIDLLLTMHFTLFPESEYQLRFGAGGGDAFGAGPILQATAGISRMLAPNLILDLTAVGSRLWQSGNAAVISRQETVGVVGIVGQQIPSKSMYTTSFGISAGLRVRM